MRLMGLDVGDRTVGVALSDAGRLIAQPLLTLPRPGDGSEWGQLAQLVREHEVTEVVVGLPRRTGGALGPEAQKVQGFAEELRRRLDIPVRLWDERFTTAEAERVMVAAGTRRHKRRAAVNHVAAALILQGFLDFQRNA